MVEQQLLESFLLVTLVHVALLVLQAMPALQIRWTGFFRIRMLEITSAPHLVKSLFQLITSENISFFNNCRIILPLNYI
jgi:hypothetical protein